ncbi:MAG: chloride channel protein [Desulfococcaceae bacterium]
MALAPCGHLPPAAPVEGFREAASHFPHRPAPFLDGHRPGRRRPPFSMAHRIFPRPFLGTGSLHGAGGGRACLDEIGRAGLGGAGRRADHPFLRTGGPGVPEVFVSVVSRQSAIRHRVTFFKALAFSLLIGVGASAGRECPIGQIGASAGSSLAAGAALGVAVGAGMDGWVSDFALNPAHCALTGMGAVAAGNTLAPITAVVAISELALNELVILPVMVASIAGMAVVRLVRGHSVVREARLPPQGYDVAEATTWAFFVTSPRPIS